MQKKKLISECITRMEKVAQDSQNLMNEAQQMANEYGPPKDRYDAFRTKQMRLADIYSKQFDIAQSNIRTLNMINPDKISECVEFGTIVCTDKQKVFVSISLGKIDFENDIYYAISVQVPIFKAMEGKKEGDEFSFNGIKHKILTII